MRADNKAFAKAVAPRKTIIFALQKSIKHLSLLVAFRQTLFQIKPLLSAKTLAVMHKDKTQYDNKETNLVSCNNFFHHRYDIVWSI